MATLYHYPLCPFSRKIRLLLRERNIDPDLITEAFWQKRREFIRTNPSGDVPVLIIEKIKICGHYAITEFLEEKFETTFPEDIDEKNECRRIMDWFDNKFYSEVLKIILQEKVERQFLNIEQGGGLPRLDRIKVGVHNLNYHLKYIETLLNDRFCLVSEKVNNADFTAAAHISCLDYLGDIPWKRYPRLKEWYAKIKSRPSFRSLLTDQIMSIPPRGKYVSLDF
ncbi:glutathione S-transferase family protein [OCS116 cluster bacterium]|nr:glutathione S-transferase family protein [OCS116 cluster bacterium]